MRFADADTEARYESDRFSGAVTRERVTMASGAILTTAIGLYEAHYTSLHRFEGLVMFLHVVRIYVVMPMWLGLFLLTFWRGFPRWADSANAAVIILSCWGHSVMVWAVARANPDLDLANALTGATSIVLIVAILALPMRFRSLVLTVVLANAGPLLFFHLTLGSHPEIDYTLLSPSLGLTLVGILVIMGGWFRETADRRMFAQREHARLLAAELATANANLARVNAEKNEFMTIAAHDLRAPLATVRSLIELLERGRIRTEEDRARALREMREQSGRMLALVTDYLSAHAAENGKFPIRLGKADLGAAIVAARDRYIHIAASKGQQIEVYETPDPVWVRADDGLLGQIVDNFVTNALKFSPRGAVIQIEVQVAQSIRRARLAVTDSGPGISAEDQSRLFQKFSRGDSRPTGGEPSTGFGLAASKRLAEAMAGSVGCESAPHRGSIFWIELPMAE